MNTLLITALDAPFDSAENALSNGASSAVNNKVFIEMEDGVWGFH